MPLSCYSRAQLKLMNQKGQPNSNQLKLTQVTECMPKHSILTRKIVIIWVLCFEFDLACHNN